MGTDGNLYTIDRNGENRSPLTLDANTQSSAREDSLVYRNPTWAPDGDQLAFVEFKNLGLPDQHARLLRVRVFSRSSPEELFSSDVHFPFYLFWSPDSRQISFLSNAEGDGGLVLHAAAADGSGSRLVDTGQPFYWDWSPLENEIFIHTGGSAAFNPEAVLAYLTMDDPALSEEVDLRPEVFQAPAWSPDGKFIALAVETDAGDALITLERESGDIHRRYPLRLVHPNSIR